MDPFYTLCRIILFVPRAVLYVIRAVFVRIKRANIPLLVAFVSALFMFLRALSGAGYIDQSGLHVSPLNNTQGMNQTPIAGYLSPDGFSNLTSYWFTFKDAVFHCSEDIDNNANGEVNVNNGKGDSGDREERKQGLACVKAKLGALGDRVMAASGARFAPEDRAFRASLDVVPPRRRSADML